MAKSTKAQVMNIRPEILDRAIPIGDVQPHPRNYRHGDLSTIAASLTQNGQYRPVIVQKSTGLVCAGNHTWRAAAELLGWTHIAADLLDIDDDTAARILAVDNAASDKATNDDQALAELLQELEISERGLAGTGYDSDDLDTLLDALERAAQLPAQPAIPVPGFSDATPDTPPEEPVDRPRPILATIGEPLHPAEDDLPEADTAAPITQHGDLWILGRHRLLCGSALNPDDLDAARGDLYPEIIYADPPYGISSVSAFGKVGNQVGYPFGGATPLRPGRSAIVPTTSYLPVIGDDSTDTARHAYNLLTAAYTADSPRHIWWGANHYTAAAGLPDSRCWLVWDKVNGNTDFADCELAWTNHGGSVRRLALLWNGLARAEREKRIHPNQKPVGLARWAFTIVDRDGTRTVVLDPFAGSGSALIAAEQTNRTCVALELEPHYCDLIARRFQTLTGQSPTLERAGTRTQHDMLPQPAGAR